MKLILCLLTILLSITPVFSAKLSVKPGLWSVEVQVEKDGKSINVSDQMTKAMAKLTPEQKTKMMALMGNMASPKGTHVCFTQEMLSPEKLLKQQSKKKCDVKLNTSSSTLMSGTFQCEDGTKGDMKWLAKTPESMVGSINSTSPKSGNSVINYSSKFLKKDCGKVKPPIF